ncbi:MAG TPA: hypothetical protein VFE22_11860 [Edaphobacter sp.]|nr:hypothetical protein [Edaphobacter sp.]
MEGQSIGIRQQLRGPGIIRENKNVIVSSVWTELFANQLDKTQAFGLLRCKRRRYKREAAGGVSERYSFGQYGLSKMLGDGICENLKRRVKSNNHSKTHLANHRPGFRSPTGALAFGNVSGWRVSHVCRPSSEATAAFDNSQKISLPSSVGGAFHHPSQLREMSIKRIISPLL